MKTALRGGVHALNRSQLGRVAKSWLLGHRYNPAKPVIRGEGIRTDIVVYFAETPDKLYQLDQWLPVFTELARHRSLVLVFRDYSSMLNVGGRTDIPLIFLPDFHSLVEFYDRHDYRVVLYVNNGMKNFQSLSHPGSVHIHLDHGESDKTSSISNQIKAYDKVFVAGRAALDRCTRTLRSFDSSKLVTIGRPPLDFAQGASLEPDDRLTVLYAPTWPGENGSNNFSSLDVLGPRIIAGLVEEPSFRVVYKPHPRVASVTHGPILVAHQRILDILHSHHAKGMHLVADPLSDVLAYFPRTDVLITDVSSVGPDFLFLRPDAGLLLTHRYSDSTRMAMTSPLGGALGELSVESVSRVVELVKNAMQDEERKREQSRLRRYYFSATAPGESSRTFQSAIDDAIEERALESGPSAL